MLAARSRTQGRRANRRHLPLHRRRRSRCRCAWMAYMAGFGGDGERGLKMIEEAAAYRGDNQDGRAVRADPALQPRAAVRRGAEAAGACCANGIPRNRLVWLESGSTCLRAGRPADAERFIDEGLASGSTATSDSGCSARTRCGYYKRGAARAALARGRRRGRTCGTPSHPKGATGSTAARTSSSENWR